MAAKKYLLGVANKNYMELVEKRKEEIKKEQEELEKLQKKAERQKQKRKEKEWNTFLHFLSLFLVQLRCVVLLKVMSHGFEQA